MAKLFLAILVVALAAVGQGYIQEFVLHDSAQLDGSYFLFRKHVDDLTTCFSSLSGYCTRGFWVAYTDTQYEGAAANVHGFNNTLTCFDESFPYKSVRFGGPLDTSKAGISLYPEEGYQGEETLVTGPASALLTGKSFLYTKSSEWTLYEGQDFTGASICTSFSVDYNDLEIYGHVNVTNTLGLPQVSSVLRGCDAKAQESLAEYLAMNLKN